VHIQPGDRARYFGRAGLAGAGPSFLGGPGHRLSLVRRLIVRVPVGGASIWYTPILQRKHTLGAGHCAEAQA